MVKLGKFEIKEQLGQGGMGVVYRAWDTKMERMVALKTISPDKATRAEFLRRFRKEALSAGRLDHPNIVTVYEFDEQDDVCYIAMQFLEGSDLEGLLSSPKWEKECTIFRRLDLLIQVCGGLGYAHRHEVIHRDVKPANIIILADGTPKIVDFGIARLGDATGGTQGMILGTAPYMAPELIDGKSLDERVDIFAMGVVAYRMFTGHFPFQAPNLNSILYKITHDPPPPLSAYLQDFPPDLERIILTALAKDRDQRYRFMEEMGFDLQRLLSSLNSSLITSYVDEAQRLVLEQDFLRARDLVKKVLELEPGHPTASTIWQQVQKQLQQESAQRKVQTLLNEGLEAYQKSDWAGALECFVQGLEIEPGHEMLRTYQTLTLQEKAKSETVSQRLKAARGMFQRRDVQGARRLVMEALDLSPENAGARELLAELDDESAGTGKRRTAQQYLEQVQETLAGKDYPGAINLLDKAKALDPESSQVDRLRSVVLAQQAEAEKQKVRAEKIAAVQKAMDRGDLATALAEAERGLEACPNDPALQQLHTRARMGQGRAGGRDSGASRITQDEVPTGFIAPAAAGQAPVVTPSSTSAPALQPEAATLPPAAGAALARPSGPRRGVLWKAVSVAVVLIAVVAGVWKSQKPGAPPIAANQATVRLDVTPWAELKEVKNLSTSALVNIAGQTPLEFSLPPGEYRLLLSHPKFAGLSIPIRVEAGKVIEIRRAFTQFDPAQVLKAYE